MSHEITRLFAYGSPRIKFYFEECLRMEKFIRNHFEIIYTDKVYCVYDVFSLEAYKRRDKYMVDNSSLLIAVEGKRNGGTARTIMYARKLECEVVLISGCEIQ